MFDLVLTAQSRLSQGEQNQLLRQTHPLHGSGLLFGCLARTYEEGILDASFGPGIWQ